MKINWIYVIIFALGFTSYGQNFHYVNAENGLIVRDEPSKSANRVGKLPYGTQVVIKEYSGNKFSIQDDGQTITGEYVLISGYDNTENISGYIFSGYLTTERLKQKSTLVLNDVVINFYSNSPWAFENKKKYSALTYIELGDNTEDVQIKIADKNYKKVAIFQRYETSLTVMNDGPHCDLTEWKHYNSKWIELSKKDDDANAFISHTIEDGDYTRFIDVTLDDVKDAVKEHCGEDWYDHMKNIKTISEYPMAISISRVFFKIVITRQDNTTSEKIITCMIPMGC
ncbi:MAG: SH3 domain-containing protein [Flavobacteriaceae bacterium]|nr:SH3 domain-containing protein [Flavobacteriaceae bacterium]